MVEEDFSYEVNKNDRSIFIVRDREDFYGYKEANPTNFSKDLITLRDEINNDKDISNNHEFSNENCDKEYVKSSKRLWKDLGIELQTVQYLKPPCNYTSKDFYGHIPDDFFDFLADDYPTVLPIETVSNPLDIGVNEILLRLKRHNAVIYKSISLPEVEKRINSSIYAHEITHIEQESAGGGVLTITNVETLPVFMEFLFGSKIDESNEVIKNIINHRLAYTSAAIDLLLKDKYMDFENRINKEKYIISIIQALDLFNKYNDGSENVKKEFIKLINGIFYGNNIIEEMLDTFDSNFKDIEPKLKVLKRY